MATYLVTGSSRGLGLALVTELASLPSEQVRTIFATARSSNSTKLKELVKSSAGRVVFVQLDTTDQTSVIEAAKRVETLLENRGLDHLINNAGIMNWTPDGLHTM
jgi:NAD(P)-dependent dehydrogenase (short-subunit alcohol dehydrogenase family)